MVRAKWGLVKGVMLPSFFPLSLFPLFCKTKFSLQRITLIYRNLMHKYFRNAVFEKVESVECNFLFSGTSCRV